MIFNFFKPKYRNLEIIGEPSLVKIGLQNIFSRNVVIDVTKGGSVEIGNNNCFFNGVLLMTYGGFIKLGNNCSVNPYSILYGHGGLQIGDMVRIAAHCTFIPANHVYDSIDIPIYKQGLTKKGILLEDDIWIGAGVSVLDDVKIGKGVVVAAGTVVNSSLEASGVYGGVPVRLLKKRT